MTTFAYNLTNDVSFTACANTACKALLARGEGRVVEEPTVRDWYSHKRFCTVCALMQENPTRFDREFPAGTAGSWLKRGSFQPTGTLARREREGGMI